MSRERQPSMWERQASLLGPKQHGEDDPEKSRRLSQVEIVERVRAESVPETKGEAEALQIAKEGI